MITTAQNRVVLRIDCIETTSTFVNYANFINLNIFKMALRERVYTPISLLINSISALGYRFQCKMMRYSIVLFISVIFDDDNVPCIQSLAGIPIAFHSNQIKMTTHLTIVVLNLS